tara:strand:+ start:1410 stop:3029 length:1620 start_codon:yes stop_codon:yes gene_type:complete
MSDAVRQRSAILNDFSGGLNNFWDSSIIADNEVPFLQNLEFMPAGALRSRPPIWEDATPTLPEANVHFDLLGYYIQENGDRFGVYTSATKTYIFDLTNTWTEIWDQKASDFVQFKGFVIMCRTNGAGAYWGPNGAETWNGTAWVTGQSTEVIATLPPAAGLELHQERLFAFGPRGTATQSVMYWSNITGEIDTNPEQDWRYWNVASAFAAVNDGDGQWITGLVAGYNDLTVFRNDSTYRYTFSSLPEEGFMAKVQEGIGAENQRCIVRYENAIIVLSADQTYSYYNGVFQSLNDQRVRFENAVSPSTLAVPYAMSILGARLIVFYAGAIYVLQLKTGAWSTWETSTGFAYTRVVPSPSDTIDQALEGWAISNGAAGGNSAVYRICDHLHTGDGPEQMVCSLRTKIYDFKAPNEWKRLYWWAAEVMGVGDVTAKVFPVSLETTTQSTWDWLEEFTYDELLTTVDGWDNPAPFPFNVTTVRTFNWTRPERINLKLDHALRFRRVYFELYVNTDGTASTGPARIFSISPMIGTKAKISERVS